MIRLYLDEDCMRRSLVAGLRAAGFDVLTAAEALRRGEPDEGQLLFAASQERVCYTSNVGDFSALHIAFARSGRAHSGIIVLTDQLMGVGEQLRRLNALAAATTEEEMRSRLEWLGRWA